MGRHKPGRTYLDKTQTHTATSAIPRTTPTHSHKPVGHPITASTDAHHTKQHCSRPPRGHRHHHCGTTHLYTNHNEETSDHQPTRTNTPTYHQTNNIHLQQPIKQTRLPTDKHPKRYTTSTYPRLARTNNYLRRPAMWFRNTQTNTILSKSIK